MSTSIEWCDETWNPVVGCTRVSAGCDHCYAMGVAHRFARGLTKVRPKDASRPGVDWTGEVRTVPERLAVPLGWKKPRRIFVNSMSDLFHERVPEDFIAEVFGVMAVAGCAGFCATYDAARNRWRDDGRGPHTFLVLTKRGQRLALLGDRRFIRKVAAAAYRWAHDRICAGGLADDIERGTRWPLPNVHVGVSAEDQRTWDERVPLLLQAPAALHWVSYEPALGPIDGSKHLRRFFLECPDEDTEAERHEVDPCQGCTGDPRDYVDGECGAVVRPALKWVVVGGESGPGARPFDIAWARAMVSQCREADVAVFVKQLGARAYGPCPRCEGSGYHHGFGEHGHDPDWCTHCGGAQHEDLALRDRKGGDMSEWPEDLRVRQLPEVRR